MCDDGGGKSREEHYDGNQATRIGRLARGIPISQGRKGRFFTESDLFALIQRKKMTMHHFSARGVIPKYRRYHRPIVSPRRLWCDRCVPTGLADPMRGIALRRTAFPE